MKDEWKRAERETENLANNDGSWKKEKSEGKVEIVIHYSSCFQLEAHFVFAP